MTTTIEAALNAARNLNTSAPMIADVFAAMGLPRRYLGAFKEELLEAYRAREIELSRLDMPQCEDPRKVTDSMVKFNHMELHCIRV